MGIQIILHKIFVSVLYKTDADFNKKKKKRVYAIDTITENNNTRGKTPSKTTEFYCYSSGSCGTDIH